MKTKTEAQAVARRKWRRKERIVSFSSVASSASVELTTQTSKCEPVMTEAQAETEGWVNKVFLSLSAEIPANISAVEFQEMLSEAIPRLI